MKVVSRLIRVDRLELVDRLIRVDRLELVSNNNQTQKLVANKLPIKRDRGFDKKWAFLTQTNLLCSSDFKPDKNKTSYTFPISFNVLKAKYLEITSTLNKKQTTSKKQTTRTESENRFYLKLGIKNIKRSVWIGNFNVDFLLLRKSNNNNGVTIEIDGKVHNGQVKIRKDHHRIKFFAEKLNLAVTSVLNEDLTNPTPTLNNLINGFREFERLDTRVKGRLWRRIYAITIAYHTEYKDLQPLFNSLVDESLQMKKKIKTSYAI